MELDYKLRLGAELMGRDDFVNKVKRSRIENRGIVLQCLGGDRESAKELIDWQQPCSGPNISALHNNGSGHALNGESNNTTSNKVASESNRKRPHNDEKKC